MNNPVDPVAHRMRHTFQPSGSRAPVEQRDPPVGTYNGPPQLEQPEVTPPPQRPLPDGMLEQQADRLVSHDLVPVPEDVRSARLEELKRDAPALYELVVPRLQAALAAAVAVSQDTPPPAEPQAETPPPASPTPAAPADTVSVPTLAHANG